MSDEQGYHSIECDHPQCKAWCGWYTSEGEVAEIARKSGWAVTPEGDLCPGHSRMLQALSGGLLEQIADAAQAYVDAEGSANHEKYEDLKRLLQQRSTKT